MRTSEERVRELHTRMDARRKAKASRRLSASVLAVTLGLAASIAAAVRISNMAYVEAAGLAGNAEGSIFAERGALGVIVVAVLAFCLGSAVTILCYRLRTERRDMPEAPVRPGEVSDGLRE